MGASDTRAASPTPVLPATTAAANSILSLLLLVSLLLMLLLLMWNAAAAAAAVAGNLGSMLSSAYATNIGGLTIMGMQGWRFAFITVAVISALAGVAMWIAAKDPRCSKHTWQLDEHYRHTAGSSSSDTRTAGSSSSSSHDQYRHISRTVTSEQHGTPSMVSSSRTDVTTTNGRDQQGGGDPTRHKTGGTAAAGRESESGSLLRGRAAAGPAGLIDRLQQFLRSNLARETWVVLSTPSFMVVVVQVRDCAGRCGVQPLHPSLGEYLITACWQKT